jgi:hypothetical protein
MVFVELFIVSWVESGEFSWCGVSLVGGLAGVCIVLSS